jgi:site-specific DNA-methyltransferase (adenine-specific)
MLCNLHNYSVLSDLFFLKIFSAPVIPNAPKDIKAIALIKVSFSGFTSLLITSNLKGFKYRWDWNKKIPSGMGYAKYRPMQQTEDICVFTRGGEKTNYNPQMIKRDKPIKSGGNTIQAGVYHVFKCMGEGKKYEKTYDEKFPVTLIEFDKVRKGALHPTQKPVALFEYLIKTYTNEGETVLDNCMGSGTTGVACKLLNRNFIGIEMDAEYHAIAQQRIRHAND